MSTDTTVTPLDLADTIHEVLADASAGGDTDVLVDHLRGHRRFTPGRDEAARRQPDVSPLYADLTGMPPALFVLGEIDCRGDLIDVGCGTGRDALFLASHGLNYLMEKYLPDKLAHPENFLP